MSPYRNRYLLAGFLLLFAGVQFRMVQSFVLNEPTTRALAKISEPATPTAESSMNSFLMRVVPNPRKTVTPPRWLGLSMITFGAVIVFHSLVIPRASD